MLGGYLCDYSKGRYGFIAYAIIPLFSIVFSWRMSTNLEESGLELVVKKKVQDDDQEEIKENEEVVQFDRNTFSGRCKSDYQIIKENMKTPVVYRFYLFWVLVGLIPSFSGMDYYWMKDVYKITQVQYGTLNIVASFSMIAGTYIYQRYLKEKEMKTLFYISTLISVFGLCVNLFQIFRINIKWGISDMTVLLFGSSVLSAVQFALT